MKMACLTLGFYRTQAEKLEEVHFTSAEFAKTVQKKAQVFYLP